MITISGGSRITEGGSTTFTIAADPAPASPITVNLLLSQTGGYGATGPASVSLSGTSASYTVSVPDNDLDQADGSVTVTVQAGTGYTVGAQSSRKVAVADNDDPPEVKDKRAQLITLVTELRDKYAQLQHDSLTHWSFYQRSKRC